MRVSAAVFAALAVTAVAACSTGVVRPHPSATVPLDSNAPYSPTVDLDRTLRDTIARYRKEWTIPGAAFATFTCESRRMAWDGVTRFGEDTPIGPHALYPLEMHVPQMLATAALRLERRGVLQLDAPLSELWPSAARRSPWYADITLAALMSFRPPIPAFAFRDSASRVPRFTARGEQSAALRATRWFLKQRPDSIPARHGFSRPSIVVAAGILEHVTGKPIVDVIREEVFAPLDLRATFVPRGQYGPNQPRGHYQFDDLLRYPWHDQLAGPGPYFEASQIAISLPDYVSFLQAHLCAAQGRPNVLLTHAEALRMYGDTESLDATPLGWMSLNYPRDPIRIVDLQHAGFSGFGGFSKLTGRGALMLMNMQGLYATYAYGWALAELFGYDPGEMPKTRGEMPRR